MNDRPVKLYFWLREGVESFIKGDEAPTAVEYAIMAGFIGAVIVAAVTGFGVQVAALFEPVEAGLTP